MCGGLFVLDDVTETMDAGSSDKSQFSDLAEELDPIIWYGPKQEITCGKMY